MEDVKQQVYPSDLLIEVETGTYPVTLEYIRGKFNDRSFARYPYLDDLKSIGYDIVKQTGKPEGDVVTEAPPKLIDDVYYRQWEVRAYNEDELKDNLLEAKNKATAQLEDLLSSELAKGCIVTLEEHVFTVPLDQFTISILLGKRILGIAGSNAFWTLENELVVLDEEDSKTTIDTVIKHYNSLSNGVNEQLSKVWDASKVSDIPATFTLVV